MSAFPKIIICDLGKVLVDFSYQHQRPTFLEHCSVGPERVQEFFSQATFLDYERGRVSNEAFFEAVKRDLGWKEDYACFVNDFCESLKLNRDVFDFVFSELKSHPDVWEIWLLSNLGPLHYEYVRAKWPGIFSNCRRVFVSCERGCRKPDPEIYAAVLEESGQSPYVCCLIDDLEANCLAAQKFGFDYIIFDGVDHIREALRSRTVTAVAKK